MSSLFAHLAAGATVFACRGPKLRTPTARRLLPACLALAVLPDMDYLAWWLLRVNVEPRVTHSLAFAAMGTALAWAACRRGAGAHSVHAGRNASPALFGLLLAAAGSHLLLDFLVGVHPAPLAWPLSGRGFASPIGLLPSAGRLDITNPYLWRNLLIEAGVLGPLLAGAVALRRRAPGQRFGPAWWLGAMVCGGFLAWSMSLSR
jgi:inner membrane protein